MLDKEPTNYYEILEVPTTATQEEIYAGYMRVKITYAQDNVALYSLMTLDECHKILESVEEAYCVLSSPGKRREYDAARGIKQDYVGLGTEAEVLRAQGKEQISNNFEEHESTTTIKLDSNITGEILHHAPSIRQESISKMVVQKRFKLDYDIDPNMEQAIEKCTEFTGEFLRKIREYKKMDLERLADLTRISKTYLQNIEAEIFENLPAMVYVRGFVYQYAKCLRRPPDIVANSYLARMKSLSA